MSLRNVKTQEERFVKKKGGVQSIVETDVAGGREQAEGQGGIG